MSQLPPVPVKPFDSVLTLTRYPAPLALAYGGLVECETPLARLFALRDVVEVSLKFCAAVMIKDYLRLGTRASAVDSSLAADLRRPSLGAWNNLWRETARCLQKTRTQAFAPQLVDFYFEANGSPRKRNHDLVERLIKFRNRVVGHGARPRDDEAEKVFQATQPLAEQLLAELDFLADYSLLFFDETGAGVVLNDDHSESIAPPVVSSFENNHLFLKHDENLLPLYPLLLREPCDFQVSETEVCRHVKIFFFNGGDRKPEFLDYLMNHSKHAPHVADALSEIVSGARQHLNVEAEEGVRGVSLDLMREMTRTFVGREIEEETTLRFLKTENRGYLKIVGDPGIGKSSLLSQIVLDLTDDELENRSAKIVELCAELRQSGLAVAFHVCTGRRKSTLDAPQIISSLIEQLVKQYGAAIRAPSKRSLDALFDIARVARQRFGAKALLVIDGIDETLVGRSPPEQEAMLDALPLKEELPEGVFVLVSARRGVLDDLPAPAQTLKLSGLSDENIKQMFAAATAHLTFDEKHLQALRRVSESNPLYLYLLIDDLRRGNFNLDEIERLPQGLSGYFEEFIRRLCVDPVWMTARDCLLSVAIARSHLSVKQICAINDFSWAATEEAISSKLRPILVDAQTSSGEIGFQIFHEKFREFVLELFSEKASAETLARLNKHFVKNAPPELRESGEPFAPRFLQTSRARLLEYCRRWRELADDYPLKHLPFHLFEANAVDELKTLLLQTEFSETKIRSLEDTFPAAQDARYLTALLLNAKRDDEIVDLAVTEHAERRDGVIAALSIAAPDERKRIEKIVGALLARRARDSSILRILRLEVSNYLARSENISIEFVNARRAAVEVASRLGLTDKLIDAARDDSELVRALLVPYLYRFWKTRRADGWELLGRLSDEVTNAFGLPNRPMLEAYGGMSAAILIYHFNEPEIVARLRSLWKTTVRKVLHLSGRAEGGRAFLLRLVLRASVFLLTNALRLLLSRQPTFQPINLREMAISYKRPGAEQRLGLAILKCLEDPANDFEQCLGALFDTKTPFGIYLMMILERVFVLRGAQEPERAMRVLYQVHREGCEWFRQSGLYAAFHILKRAATVKDEWLDWYAEMTRETVGATGATFTTGKFTYELQPHIAWAEMIFDKYRPTGKARFIPEFYRAAKQTGDVEFARRALEACAILSVAYKQHDLALDAIRVALKEPDPKFRQLVVNPLAQIRFNEEEAVERFLEGENEMKLAQQISVVASNLKINDITVWVDDFMNNAMIESDYFRAEILGAFERAGHARNLTELLRQVLKWVINLSVGEELLPIKVVRNEE